MISALTLLSLVIAIASAVVSFLLYKNLNGLLPSDTEPTNILKRLTVHQARQRDLKRMFDELQDLHEQDHAQLSPSLKHVGLVRFNPYRDTGGDQSFALCLLDSQKDGILLTAIHAREGTRIYAKKIKQGGSEHELSEEERLALQQALNT